MKKAQNIYDNKEFFDGYAEIRKNPFNCNNLEEAPAFFAMLPALTGKSILDLGCGNGENCGKFMQMGAKEAVGIDISENMLAVARGKHPNIEFIKGDISDISYMDKQFDVIVSSLAVHYVEDFSRFCKSVYARLKPGGVFLFTQEHPLNTASTKTNSFTYDGDGTPLFFNLDSYTVSGERREKWIVDDVLKYHRNFSDIINGLADAGFRISQIAEPLPDKELSKDDPKRDSRLAKRLHCPIFLLIRAEKN